MRLKMLFQNLDKNVYTENFSYVYFDIINIHLKFLSTFFCEWYVIKNYSHLLLNINVMHALLWNSQ